MVVATSLLDFRPLLRGLSLAVWLWLMAAVVPPAFAQGFVAVPQRMHAPGLLITGDGAGFVNVPALKGIHYAIESGRLAAEAAFAALQPGRTPWTPGALAAYDQSIRDTFIWTDLKRVRNMRQPFGHGFWFGSAMAAMATMSFGMFPPGNSKTHRDAEQDLIKTKRASRYPEPDGKLTFDKLSSVFLSNTNHEENQPSHLTLRDAGVPVAVNLALYDGPEQRYCPAGVYEYVADESGSGRRLQVNAQNCVHCKTCDIKDPRQNIRWVTPEGGGGPVYPGM